MREIKSFISPDAKRRLHLYERANGFFSFEETYEDYDDLTEFGMGIEAYWTPGYQSGLYESAEAAERDALAITPWLRQTST
jgi:hypothetical protein